MMDTMTQFTLDADVAAAVASTRADMVDLIDTEANGNVNQVCSPLAATFSQAGARKKS